MSELQDFWSRLNRGPAVLFLGQGYLKIETGTDPLLAEIEREFGSSAGQSGTYSVLHDIGASQGSPSFLAWVAERCRRLSPPQWLRSVAEFPWNAVYTSAIDTVWLGAFRNEWRQMAPIYSDEYFPLSPRNRQTLHGTFLFGSTDQTEAKERTPSTRLEYLSRKAVALSLARRLNDIVTPLGTIVIEGYTPATDWFPIEDFYAVLGEFGPSQVHFFSANERLARDEIVSELVKIGKAILHEEPLVEALQRGIDQGSVYTGSFEEPESGVRQITLKDRTLEIPRHIWNQMASWGTVLDNNVLTPPSPVSDDARYWEFRRFLFESGTRPMWSGYARGFAFPRAFETVLHSLVQRSLLHDPTSNKPIIVHGPTGTGKTVALGALAHGIALSGEYPTIFVERRTKRPTFAHIDQACQWLEDHSNRACLIVWDGMLPVNDYYELQSFLASRGRRVVLVGSTYKQSDTGINYCEVPPVLTRAETRDFETFLKNLGFEIRDELRALLERQDDTFLVALYRLLPPARPRIRAGVVEELEKTEEEIRAAVAQLGESISRPTTLAQAFIQAGIIDADRAQELVGSQVGMAHVQDLVDLVMVPGQFGISVPIELLVRAWGMNNYWDVSHILENFDILRSLEDDDGDVVVSPRHRLEARFIVQARQSGIQAEVDLIARLVRAIKAPGISSETGDEIDFAMELLRAVGPQGEERARFSTSFKDFAAALTELRTTRAVQNPRLMLQEANLLREWVSHQPRLGDRQRSEESLRALAEAQDVLEQAIDMLDDNRRNNRLRQFIATELAAVTGTGILGAIDGTANRDELLWRYNQLKLSVDTARSTNPNSYHPVDILAWVTKDIAQSGVLDEPERMDAIVDALDAVNTVDVDLLSPVDLSLLQGKRAELATLAGDDQMRADALEALEKMGSAAGYYLRAWELGGSPQGVDIVDDATASRFEGAWEYLQSNRGRIANDPRCLNLLFDYWWQSKVRRPLFNSERLVWPFGEADCLYLTELARDLKELQASYRWLSLALLEGIALFHDNRMPEATQVFKEVESESYRLGGRRRIIRYFLAGGAEGGPKRFHGTVRWVSPDGRRGEVFVDELGQRITFIPNDFSGPDVRIGDSIGDFHIGFNFIGPIADNPIRYEG